MNLLLAALAASGSAEAGEIGRTHAFAVTTVGHGAWLGGVGGAVSTGEPGGLALAATATHVNLLTTPVFLHRLEPADAATTRRLEQAWFLYYAGLGITAAGWGVAGVTAEDADAIPGLVVMALADLALIGATGLVAGDVIAADAGTPPPAPVVPLVVTRF